MLIFKYLVVDWSNTRRLLREIAVGWRPRRAKPEEAPAPPRGKRSLVRKSTAVFKRANLILRKKLKSLPFTTQSPKTNHQLFLFIIKNKLTFCKFMIK
ncbi:hypothetical protein C4588_00990 [Candidatus Parcubacteria bacterium]|nr:MAG: hypothetical protein C4588_00990 [Candidatus Parcubacteria bacterium]